MGFFFIRAEFIQIFSLASYGKEIMGIEYSV